MLTTDKFKKKTSIEDYFPHQRQYNHEGFGKVILFGEHFVVYGIPAIAAALDLRTIATIRPFYGRGILIEDHTMDCCVHIGHTANYILDHAIQRILKLLGIDWNQESMSILLESNIPIVGGLGTSAAVLVALTRLFSTHFNLNLSDDEISQLVWEGEKVFAGTPSGIDNSISTFGGILWFQKGRNHSNIIKPIKLKKSINIVIGNTGISHNTKELVTIVREHKTIHPGKFNHISSRVHNLVKQAKIALLADDILTVGNLMTENHRLLREIGVSSPELEHLVKIALDYGAYGAKLTGAGGGGCMIALTPNKEIQNNVASMMEQIGYQAKKTAIHPMKNN